MKKFHHVQKTIAIIAIFLLSADCKAEGKITVQDYLESKSVEDILRKNPSLRKDPPGIFPGQQEIVRAILADDLGKVSDFFDQTVSIEIGEVYYNNFKITKSEKKRFLAKQSVLYKFVFDTKAAREAIPQAQRTGANFHAVKDFLKNGTYIVSTSAIIGFDLMEPKPHGITIRTNCKADKCVITGFSTGGY